MKKSFKIALIVICGFLLIISAGCGSKTEDNQNQKQNMDHTNMPEMDHTNMPMDDKAKK